MLKVIYHSTGEDCQNHSPNCRTWFIKISRNLHSAVFYHATYIVYYRFLIIIQYLYKNIQSPKYGSFLLQCNVYLLITIIQEITSNQNLHIKQNFVSTLNIKKWYTITRKDRIQVLITSSYYDQKVSEIQERSNNFFPHFGKILIIKSAYIL